MYDLFYAKNDNKGWINFKKQFPHAIRVEITKNLIMDCAKLSKTTMFWIIKHNLEFVENWYFQFQANSWDQKYLHLWKINDSSGVIDTGCVDAYIQLWSKDLAKNTTGCHFTLENLQGHLKFYNNHVATYIDPFDIFFISYNEPYADGNWDRLQKAFPQSTRLNGIKGIDNAFRTCAEKSTSEMFWTVDADTIVDEDWKFDYIPPNQDRQYTHVWYTRNPVNGLEYGYGAIKLWSKTNVMTYTGEWVDYAISVGKIKIIDRVISTTAFNSSPFESWKSAFRECVKLLKNIENNANDTESKLRLETWLHNDSDEKYANWCKSGSEDAIKWYSGTPNIHVINNFDWLKVFFLNTYPNVE